ncbi:hypothetical protein JCM17380_44660 [Desulfosporosinus burensis]
MFEKLKENAYFNEICYLSKEHVAAKDLSKASDLLCNIDLDKLFRVAIDNEVASIIYPSLALIIPDRLPEEWENEYLKVKKHVTFMMNQVTCLAKVLKDVGIPLVILKNGGIALSMEYDLGKCPMGDVDTLVRKKDFIKAHNVILGQGYKFKFRSEYEFEDIEQAYQDGSTEYYKQENDNIMWFELAWRPIAGRWIAHELEPSAEDFVSHAVEIEENGAYVLSPEDNLLQVCIHTAKHSYIREPGFRLHLDVERIVNRTQIDWDLFIRKAEETKVKAVAYFSLYIPHVLFGTPIPNEVLNRLKPNQLKERILRNMIERGGILNDGKEKFSKISFIMFQLLLYDSVTIAWKVAFPGVVSLKKKYGGNSTHRIIIAQIKHIMDLAGVRKKKTKK